MDSEHSGTFFDLAYFFELSPDLLCIAGYDGYFKKINPAVSKALGYSNEELFAKPINSFVHPDDQEMTSKSRESIRGDNPLLNFENRYIAKSGEIIWLSWTSMPIKRDNLIFAIAKKIFHKPQPGDVTAKIFLSADGIVNERLRSDQIWLNNFEAAVKKYIGHINLSITLLSHELAISERQLFREIKRIRGITPNKLIKDIRLQVALEAISTGKYTTLSEISTISGFDTPAYFNKLFKEVYHINVSDLLSKSIVLSRKP